jgi:predicted amidophosphoribosyltransferase
MLSAHCGECHASFEGLHLGAGMLTFTQHCAVPALCSNCETIVDRDYLEPAPRCPTCGGEVSFYDDPELRGGPPPEDTFFAPLSWRLPDGNVVTLSPEGSLCPRCGAGALSFHQVGAFD